MPNKTFTWLLIILLLVGLSGGGAAYYFYNKADKAESQLKVSQNNVKQNKLYFDEQLKLKADSIVNMSGLVFKLNEDGFKKNKLWKFQESQFKAEIEALRAKGTGIASTGGDDKGKYAKVDFSGKKGIFTFEGWTKYYENPFVKPTWGLNGTYDEVMIFAEFYRDEQGIWKLHTESRTPGIKIRPEYKIDSTFYNALGDMVFAINNDEEFDTFGFELEVLAGGTLVEYARYKSNVLDFSNISMFYDNFKVGYYPFMKGFAAGFNYKFDLTRVKNFFNKITSIF